MKLDLVRYVDERQVAFGKKLGLDFEKLPLAVAVAMLEDDLLEHFHGEPILPATEKQVAFAETLGFDVTDRSKGVAGGFIQAAMEQLDRVSIRDNGLAPGVQVRHTRYDTVDVVSSVREDGMVFFRGGNGRKAWARSLERYDGPPTRFSGSRIPLSLQTFS